jgi:hypothetical protein
VRDPRLSVDPDRHARCGQRCDPACGRTWRRLVGYQSDINAAFLGADERLDYAGACR